MTREASLNSRNGAAVLEPFLKWPGGKRRLLKFILPVIPKSYGRYYEPFLGSGALFFALNPRAAFLSDKEPDLICAYSQVRNRPGEVTARLGLLKNTEENYYSVRSTSPRSLVGKAARLIYLSNLSFNGIHRVNLNGLFNVPYGHKTHMHPCDPVRLAEASLRLKRAKITCQDFEDAISGAAQDDLVYLDPPYTTAHGNNGFIKYNAKIFTWDDQKRLAAVATKLRRRGCHVVVSNADHRVIRELYRGFSAIQISRHSVIAASGEFRRRITECLFLSRAAPHAD